MIMFNNHALHSDKIINIKIWGDKLCDFLEHIIWHRLHMMITHIHNGDQNFYHPIP
jgi:hypothetical protein